MSELDLKSDPMRSSDEAPIHHRDRALPHRHLNTAGGEGPGRQPPRPRQKPADPERPQRSAEPLSQARLQHPEPIVGEGPHADAVE